MTARTGKITREGELATIEFERRMPYSMEAVWAALTDPFPEGGAVAATALVSGAGRIRVSV